MLKITSVHLIFFIIFWIDANGTYFTMRDITLNLPSDSAKYSPHEEINLFNIWTNNNNNYKEIILEKSDKFLRIINGSIRFKTKEIPQKEDNYRNVLRMTDNIGQIDRTSIAINFVDNHRFDCQDLCFWTNVSYRVEENIQPITLGTLSGGDLLKILCKEYKIDYALIEDRLDEYQVLRNGYLKTLRRLERDLSINRPKPLISCRISDDNGKFGKIIRINRTLNVDVMDLDDNPPYLQHDDRIAIRLTSPFIIRGHTVNQNDLIFLDRDLPQTNNYHTEILNDTLDILGTNCTKYENNREGEPHTALYCKLVFKKDMHLMENLYRVTLQINDTTLKMDEIPPTLQIPIDLEIGNQEKIVKKQFKRTLYPGGEFKLFRTAAPFARVTQPLTNQLRGYNFSLHESGGIFEITHEDGIVYVHDAALLRDAPVYIETNVTWISPNGTGTDLLLIRIVDEPSSTCTDIPPNSIHSWMLCAQFGNYQDCLHSGACGLGTGGASSVRTRSGPERCQWRGDKKIGHKSTHLYSTCTVDINTCPDGHCDGLELLHYQLCPQDCTQTVMFPTGLNPVTGRGIDMASGICTCDTLNACTCHMFKVPRYFNQTKNDTNIISRHLANYSEKISSELTVAHCGTTCVLGIVAGSIFLLGAIALTVICWRLDTVHKAINRKNMEETQDLAGAPLSDYIARTQSNDQTGLPISFTMTTTLNGDFITTNRYTPDPKWEFPRNRLIIEQTLGEGEFGRVLRAKAFDIGGQKGYSTVAVKTLKADARESEFNDLMSEYQLLKEVSHSNVIRLLGVCTIGGPLYVIIEFAEHGSLRNYLRKSRHLKTDTDIETVHYDEPKQFIKITPKEILSFAWQISNGMAYLSDIKLVHRDLAARNILLASDKVCKISDFGLTRDIYEDDAYFKRSKSRVPVKWMAPESLSDHIYTNKSDIWSFGVLIWELVTLGSTPYPGIAVQNLFHLLKQGYRMERPDNCSQILYNIMRNCWELDPDKRPNFNDLSLQLEKMLSDQVDYLDIADNAIHNRSYFFTESNDINPVNYLNRTQSYTKSADIGKNIETTSDKNQNIQQGYETPIKILKTPTNDHPQYYTDMAGKNK